MAQAVRHARGGFIITKPIGLISPPLCFRVCLSFTCYYLFSLFGRTEWPRQSRPSRPIELWHNRCNTSMHLSQEPLIRPSCSFHQFAPAPVGFLGGMGVRQRGLLYCMWITLDATSPPVPQHPEPLFCLVSGLLVPENLLPWLLRSLLASQLPLTSVGSDSIKC